MHSIKLLLAALVGFLSILSSASPMSPNTNLLSKDWTHVFAPGSSDASIIFGNPREEDRIRGEVQNRCPFPVYVRLALAATSSGPGGARCEHGGEETQDMELPPGRVWQTPYAARMDQCGHTIKVARNRGDRKVYQVEYSMDGHDGRLWYNLSAEDGAPFTDVDRWLGARGMHCPFVHCAAGQWGQDPVHGCDWPIQALCETLGSVVLFLCGGELDD